MPSHHNVISIGSRATIPTSRPEPDALYRAAWLAHQKVLAIGHQIQAQHPAMAALHLDVQTGRVAARAAQDAIRAYRRELNRARRQIDKLDADLGNLALHLDDVQT